MGQKFVYLLEHYVFDRPTQVGIFTSRKKAEVLLRKLSKKNQYTIYRLPLNTKLTKGKKLEDQQGVYDHWHYGTYQVGYEKYDNNSKSFEKNTQIEFNWPD